MNDTERSLWVDNDEALYAKYKFWLRNNRGRGGKRTFTREHRELIDTVAANVGSGRKRPHYLLYGE